jgi:hypothetical protein
MILATLVGFAVSISPVGDYFPLVPGTKWTYEDADGRQLVQEVGRPVDIGHDQTATPIKKSASGRDLGTDVMRIDGDTVQLVGYIDKTKDPQLNLFPDPQPLLRISSGKAEWRYTDQVFTENGPMPVQIVCDSNKGPKRKVLDRDVETVVAHSILRFGIGRSAREVRRDMVYGKGIGMVEATEATKIEGKTVKKMLKLVKFEPAEG